jgi:hypothetical protein
MLNGMRIMRGELAVPSTAELTTDASVIDVPVQPEAPEAGTWQRGLGRIARQAGNAIAAGAMSVGRMTSGDCTIHPQLGQSLYPNKED